jgi:hypothetical protein
VRFLTLAGCWISLQSLKRALRSAPAGYTSRYSGQAPSPARFTGKGPWGWYEPRRKTSDTGVFRGFKITEEAARIGDIIQNNRSGNHFDFDFAAANANYESHSAIVVARGEDSQGRFAVTVGGNESDSIRTRRVILNADGTVKQRSTSPFICIVKNLK